MTIPTDDSGWLELNRAGMAPCWRALAEGCGGSVWEDGDVLAAIIPAAPHRSVFNSVFYRDPERLLASLDEIAAAYDEAGIDAWTVWVPEAETEVAAGLERAGHKLDAEPRFMGMALSDPDEPEAPGELEISERDDHPALARINEIAYGYPPGDFAAVADAPMPGMRIYFGALDGEDVATLGIWPHRDDAVVVWVATLPEARGRGASRRLLARALADARERGLSTTTLQSTKLGFRVYERLGYRDLGAAQMWERRRA